MKALLLALLISQSAEYTNWEQYDHILRKARSIQDSGNQGYDPPAGIGCSGIYADLAVKASAGGYAIKRWPNDVIITLMFQGEPATTTIYGAVRYATKSIVINSDIPQCGAARTLAHELGHVFTYRTPEMVPGLFEIVAELIQYGAMKRIYKNPEFDLDQSTAEYLSLFYKNTKQSVALDQLTPDMIRDIKLSVYLGVELFVGEEK